MMILRGAKREADEVRAAQDAPGRAKFRQRPSWAGGGVDRVPDRGMMPAMAKRSLDLRKATAATMKKKLGAFFATPPGCDGAVTGGVAVE